MIEGRTFTWRTHRIAVDFDGCLCRNEYPDIGDPNETTIEELKRLREDGACIILWTCRSGGLLKAAVEACRSWGLEFDAVNENPQFFIDEWGNDSRKVDADEYWDDRAVYVAHPYDSFLRSLHGTSSEYNDPQRIRDYIDGVMKPEAAFYTSGGNGDLSGERHVRHLARIIQTDLEIIESLLAMNDELARRIVLGKLAEPGPLPDLPDGIDWIKENGESGS